VLVPIAPAAAGTAAQDAQDEADWRALQAELARRIPVREDARQQLVSAMLLAWPIANDAPAALKAAAAARMPEAEAIFARVRTGTDDPWVLWIAATDCRFGAALCDPDGAIDDLLRIEPDNAAVWLLALDRAHRRHDEDAQLAALQGMAASTRYDQYDITAIRAWTEASAALPELPGFNRLVARTMTEDPAAALDDESLGALAGLHGVGAALAFGHPPYATFTNACTPEPRLQLAAAVQLVPVRPRPAGVVCVRQRQPAGHRPAAGSCVVAVGDAALLRSRCGADVATG
jgi:hypothetical protein